MLICCPLYGWKITVYLQVQHIPWARSIHGIRRPDRMGSLGATCGCSPVAATGLFRTSLSWLYATIPLSEHCSPNAIVVATVLGWADCVVAPKYFAKKPLPMHPRCGRKSDRYKTTCGRYGWPGQCRRARIRSRSATVGPKPDGVYSGKFIVLSASMCFHMSACAYTWLSSICVICDSLSWQLIYTDVFSFA